MAQKLRLTAEQKRSMAAFLAWNARDENKYYLFDYYRDNCATRVRDLVDRVTAGTLSRVSQNPAEMTWRKHTDRLAADDLPVYLGLHLAMGNVIDRPIRQWEEMFLPAKLAEGVSRAGLVEREVMLVRDRRPPLRTAAPAWTLESLLGGVAAAAAWIGIGELAARGRRGARVAMGVATVALGAVAGFLGCLFLFLWIFTNHEVAYHNENILQCAPFAVGLAIVGRGALRGRASAIQWASRMALGAFACSALGLAAKVLPWFSQDNALVIAFALPLWAGVAAAMFRLRREARFPLAGESHVVERRQEVTGGERRS
jgi:hypothetical protein